MNAPLRVVHLVTLLLLGGCIERAPTEDELAAKRALTAEALQKSAEDLKREQLSLDPATCPDGDGHLYVALDRIVLRLPPLDEPLYRRPSDPTLVPLPAAPVPSEPEGCRGNPSHASMVSLWPHRRLVVPEKAYAGELPLLRLTLNGVRGTHRMQDLHRGWYADLIATGRCGDAAPGLRTCTDGNETPSSGFGADAAMHTAPDGGPFVAMCGPPVSLTPQECRVIHAHVPRFDVEYAFYVPGVQGAPTLAAADLVAFDRAVRAGIDALIVKDYRWGGE